MSEAERREAMLAAASTRVSRELGSVIECLDKGLDPLSIRRAMVGHLEETVGEDPAALRALLAEALWEMARALHEGDWT